MAKLWKSVLNNPFFNAIGNIKLLLDKDQQQRGIIMFGLLLLNAFFDVIGLASLLPLIDAAVDTSKIQTEWYLNIPYQFLGIENNISFLFALSLIVLLILTVKNLISLFIYYIQAKYSYNISLRLNKKYFQYYLDKGYLNLLHVDSGKKAYSIMDIPRKFAQSYVMQTFLVGTEFFIVFFIFLGIALYNPSLVLILILVVAPVFFLIYNVTKQRIKKIGDERNEKYPEAYSNTLESLESFIDLKLSNTEQKAVNAFSKLQKKINHLDALQIGFYQKIANRTNEIIAGLGVAVIFFAAILFPNNQDTILFTLGLFGGAAFKVIPSINRILGALIVIKSTHYVINELSVLKGQKIKTFEEVPPITFKEKIKLKNISFEYPKTEKLILNKVNFTIELGKVIGIVGSSGSGKTTLIQVIMRLLNETSGHIECDGIVLNEKNNSSFQKVIGYVQQNVFILNGTIAENIAFGEDADTIDTKKLSQAIKDASLEEYVNSLPDGIHTILGERGAKISGGQKQRIGIARALYKDAALLIFDEPTSALDYETEKEITQTINNLAQSKIAILIIAHRTSTLEKCDQIIKLEKGEILETEILEGQ